MPEVTHIHTQTNTYTEKEKKLKIVGNKAICCRLSRKLAEKKYTN